jgi:hypothetical protein
MGGSAVPSRARSGSVAAPESVKAAANKKANVGGAAAFDQAPFKDKFDGLAKGVAKLVEGAAEFLEKLTDIKDEDVGELGSVPVPKPLYVEIGGFFHGVVINFTADGHPSPKQFIEMYAPGDAAKIFTAEPGPAAAGGSMAGLSLGP